MQHIKAYTANKQLRDAELTARAHRASISALAGSAAQCAETNGRLSRRRDDFDEQIRELGVLGPARLAQAKAQVASPEPAKPDPAVPDAARAICGGAQPSAASALATAETMAAQQLSVQMYEPLVVCLKVVLSFMQVAGSFVATC